MVKDILTLLFLGVFITTLGAVVYANPYNYEITRVIDGDTVEFRAEFLPGVLKQTLYLRIHGVDTPEKSPRATCSEENMQSLRAKLFVEQEISNAYEVKIFIKSWDKFGGRVLGDVILDGEFLSVKLLSQGYAVPYSGRGPKNDWCR